MARKKILLVDDANTVLLFERLMLGPAYDYVTAGNGREALDQVAEDQPDLVLLDIMMPEMNGMECLERLKSAPETLEIPVIMVTTRGESENIEKCFALGCDDYVTKPIDKRELATKVKKYLD